MSASLSAQTAPAPPARGGGKPVAAAGKLTPLTIQVTDPLGAPVAEAAVTVTGPVAREGVTAADGSLRLTNMRPGTYRLRFVREGSITLERELTVRAGESPTVEVALSPAPVAPPRTRRTCCTWRTRVWDLPETRNSLRFRCSSRRTSSAGARLEKTLCSDARRPELRHCTSFVIPGWHTPMTTRRNGSMSSPVKARFASGRRIRDCRRARSASCRTRCRMR